MNNKPGPKKINLVKALDTPKKKEKRHWRPIMVDIVEETEEDMSTRMIAPVSKTKSHICQMRYRVTDATKVLASVKKMTQAGNRVVFE